MRVEGTVPYMRKKHSRDWMDSVCFTALKDLKVLGAKNKLEMYFGLGITWLKALLATLSLYKCPTSRGFNLFLRKMKLRHY